MAKPPLPTDSALLKDMAKLTKVLCNNDSVKPTIKAQQDLKDLKHVKGLLDAAYYNSPYKEGGQDGKSGEALLVVDQ